MSEELSQYQPLAGLAVDWERAAGDGLVSGCWMPSELEKRLARDVLKVTFDPCRKDPPNDDEPLWRRMARISCWPAALRLAALAGGRTLPGETGSPPDYEDVDLQKLVSGIYPALALIERWDDLHTNWLESGVPEHECDTRITELVPSCRDHLTDAEHVLFFIEQTFTAVATHEHAV